MSKPFYRISALIIVVIFLGLRLASLNQDGLSYDEQASLRAALCLTIVPEYPKNMSYDDFYVSHQPKLKDPLVFIPSDLHEQTKITELIPTVMMVDQGNGILHVLQSFFWVKIFGSGDTTLRLNSLLWAILTFIVFIRGTKRHFGVEIAIGSALLFSVHPILVRYGVDFRQYSMALFFSTLSTFTLMDILSDHSQKKDRRIVLYVIATCLAFFTHYLTAYVTLGHIFFCLLTLRNRRTWTALSLGGAGVMALFSFWYVNGADTGLRILGFYSTTIHGLFAQNKYPDELFTFPNFARELGIFLSQMVGLQASTTLYGMLGTIISLGVLLYCLKKGKLSRLVIMLVSIQAACLMCVLIATFSYEHFAAFTERYILFSLSFSTVLFYALLFSGEYSPIRKKLAVALFLAQFLWAFTISGEKILSTKSYDWQDKNQFQKIASQLKRYSPETYEVIYPDWNVAVLTTMYLPQAFPLKGKMEPRLQRTIFVRNLQTGEKIIIADKIKVKGR